MKIATFNANSIRARLKIIIDWLAKESPDILCIQETKVQDHDFPSEIFESKGYSCAFRGQKSYNGVAVLSLHKFDKIIHGFNDGDINEEPRLITVFIKGISIVNSYIPQGTEPDSDRFRYKLGWLLRLRSFFEKNFRPSEPVVWVGDFNIAPEPDDVYDPDRLLGEVCFHPDEHRTLKIVKEWGFTDIFRLHNREKGHYSFYDYRVPNALKRKMGWRLDHIWATGSMAENSIRSWIDLEPRILDKPSDHTFVVAEFVD
jgi:exodeoxyribonuclease-3